MKVLIFAKDENMEVCAPAHHLNLKCVPLVDLLNALLWAR